MQGFKGIEVKFSEKSKISHFFYIKQHSVREKIPQKPPDRTLFVVGIPAYCNEECIKELFTTFGKVTSVYFHKTPSPQVPAKEKSIYFPSLEPVTGFKVAYVVFQKDSYLLKALQCESTLIFPSDLITTGIQKWSLQYNNRFPNQKDMEAEIKVFMDNFDKETNKNIEIEKELSQPQEDGWVTITKRGRNPGFARKESVATHLKKKGERQRQKKELKNFYSFQIKESKIKNLITLRKKFEEDKRKIAALKEARRFRPF